MTPRVAYLVLLCLLLLFVAPGAAQQAQQDAPTPPLALTEMEGTHPAGSSLELLEDPSASLTIEDVRSPVYRDRFVPQTGPSNQFGLTKSAYWGRLILRNDTEETLWIVTLPEYFQDYIDFYLFDAEGQLLTMTETGRARAFSTRDLPSSQFSFRANVPPGEEVTVYIRNAGEFALRFPVVVESLAAFAASSSFGTLATAATYGFLILMIVKNLLVYASLRDRNYLLLTFYIIPTVLTMSLRDGRAHQLLWPDNPQLGRMISMAAIGVQQAFLLLFSISFLETRRYAPGLHKVLLALLIIMVTATLMILPAATGAVSAQTVLGILMALGFPTVILLAIAGPLVWRRGHLAARYYAAAQTVPLLFGIADLVFAFGLLAVPASVVIVPRLGTVLMVLFLSLALTDSVHVLRRQAEEAASAQRESERLSQQYLDAMPLGVAVYDHQMRLMYANAAAAALVGRDRHEYGITYSNSSKTYPSYRTSTGEPYREGEQPIYRGFQGLADSDDDLSMDVNGERIPLQVWWKPLRDTNGNPTGVVTVFSDISEKKRAEAELKRYQSELEELVRERTQDLEAANAALVAKQRVADTLSEAATLLATGPGLGPLLTRILELLQRVVSYTGAAILLEDGADILMIGAAGNAEKQLGQRLPADGPDPRARVYREGQVLVLDGDGPSLVGLDGGADSPGCRWIGLPLSADGKTFGVLALESDSPCSYEPSELSLLEAFASQAAAAVWIAQLYAQAQSNAAIAERERLARDLHDAVTQTLFSASIFTDMLPLQLAQEPEQVPKNLVKLGQLIRSALAEMRTLLMELRPAALVAVELHQLIGNLTQAARARTRIDFTYLVDGESPGPLPPDAQISIYRIAQELLNNVVKHSSASVCEILFAYTPRGVELTISDNGRGFDPGAVSMEHMGLAIMTERARAIGGHLAVDSKPNAGVRATLCWYGRKDTGEA